MAISFPLSPNVNDTYTYNNKTWTFDGQRWTTYGVTLSTVSPKVPVILAANTPGSTTPGGMWIDTDTGQLSTYTNNTWTSATAVLLDDNTVTANKLTSNSVTTTKIADLSISTAKIQNASITTNKLANGSVTMDKLDTANITLGGGGSNARTTGFSLIFGAQ